MRILFIYFSIITLVGCSHNTIEDINYTKLDSIVIIDNKSIYNREVSIKEPILIKELFTKYLFKSQSAGYYKFDANYIIKFIYNDSTFMIPINSYRFKFEGKSYDVPVEIDPFIENILIHYEVH